MNGDTRFESGTSRGLGVALVASLLVGCGAPPPERTTEQFWEAMGMLDFEAAALLAGDSTPTEVELIAGGREIEASSFGDALEDGANARVPTQLEVTGVTLPLRFDTHLVRDESSGGWLVDLRPTGQAARSAELSALFDAAAIALGDGAIALSEALEEGAREAARALEESFRELGEELQALPSTPAPAP